MALLLGIDTGGTYTDAVILRDETEVIASAKALTTRQDLAIGIGEAVRAVLDQSGVAPREIALASLSTTLATNALVEGQGGRVALVYIGFNARDLDTHGLADALKGDPYVVLAGGHNHAGGEAAPLDEGGLRAFLAEYGDTAGGFAIAAQFSTRNPAHERRAMEMIADLTGRPVSASHQLSAKLNGPKRAMTALLNARLIGMIDRLIGRAQDRLGELGVGAPLMVVRGDGALISASQARERPIETILSGPAASIVGARWLTDVDDALVSDIGGTTTDVALLTGGRPAIDPEGARVGAFRTMVEAVAMRTTGLGGDSEVHAIGEGLVGGVQLGPRRLLPVALLAQENAAVHEVLDKQLRATVPNEYDARFLRVVPGMSHEGLGSRELGLLERMGQGVRPLGEVLRARVEVGALGRLIARGVVQMGGVTPSDAAHVLGLTATWDTEAARKALALFARRRTGAGERLAGTPQEMAQRIVTQLQAQTSLALLEAAFERDDGIDGDPATLARHTLMQRGLAGHRGLLRIDAGLAVPVVGLGASAPTYYPAVGERLGCEMILPTHAGVANAIGAVVGRVTMRASGTITAPSEGRYRVHLAEGPEDFAVEAEAMSRLETVLSASARAAAEAAGAADIQMNVTRELRRAGVEEREVFVEASVTVEAAGRPRVAF